MKVRRKGRKGGDGYRLQNKYIELDTILSHAKTNLENTPGNTPGHPPAPDPGPPRLLYAAVLDPEPGKHIQFKVIHYFQKCK